MTRRLLYCAYALPLFGALTQFTHVQLSVVAMSGLSVVVAAATLRQRNVRLPLPAPSRYPIGAPVC
jgi:hypothetical protein